MLDEDHNTEWYKYNCCNGAYCPLNFNNQQDFANQINNLVENQYQTTEHNSEGSLANAYQPYEYNPSEISNNSYEFSKNDDAVYDTDQRPTNPLISNNPPTLTLVQRKELTAYPNYGNPSVNADILYTDTQGTYSFSIPPFLSPFFNRLRRVHLVIRGALDDHYNVPVSRYSMSVGIDNMRRDFRQIPFEHGRPAGSSFNNWYNLSIDINPQTIGRGTRVTIRNTSNTGPIDFIALDWLEIRYFID